MRRRGLIGVDCGGVRLTAVQLDGSSTRRVHAAVAIERRHSTLGDDVQRLVRVLARRGFQPAPVVAAPQDAMVSISELRVPARSGSEQTAGDAAPVDLIVAAQMGRLRKVEPGAMETAWWPVDGVPSGGTLRAVAVGMMTADADALAGAFDSAGLPLAAIEPRPLAIARAVEPLGAVGPQVVLDVGAEAITGIATEAGRVSFVRRFESRGAAVAEGGLPARDAFLSELRLTLGYVQRRDDRSRIERIVVSGADDLRRALTETVRASLEMTVVDADPAHLVAAGGEWLRHDIAAAIGLAARREDVP